MSDPLTTVGALYKPGVCAVCGRSSVVYKINNPFGSSRFDQCKECSWKPALPEKSFKFLYDTSRGKPDPALRNWYTWIDGKYVHWDNYVHRRKAAA